MTRVESFENRETIILKPDQLIRPFAGYEQVPEGSNYHRVDFHLEGFGNGYIYFCTNGSTISEFKEISRKEAGKVITPYDQFRIHAYELDVSFYLPVFKMTPVCYFKLSSLGLSFVGIPESVPDEESWSYAWTTGYKREKVVPVLINEKAVLNDIAIHFAPS
ncbi:MAG: hypothetical protein ACOX50_05240 [Patescibacteria group bacterium]